MNDLIDGVWIEGTAMYDGHDLSAEFAVIVLRTVALRVAS